MLFPHWTNSTIGYFSIFVSATTLNSSNSRIFPSHISDLICLAIVFSFRYSIFQTRARASERKRKRKKKKDAHPYFLWWSVSRTLRSEIITLKMWNIIPFKLCEVRVCTCHVPWDVTSHNNLKLKRRGKIWKNVCDSKFNERANLHRSLTNERVVNKNVTVNLLLWTVVESVHVNQNVLMFSVLNKTIERRNEQMSHSFGRSVCHMWWPPVL